MANELLADGGKYLEQQNTGRIYCWLEPLEEREDMKPFLYKDGDKKYVVKETKTKKLKSSSA